MNDFVKWLRFISSSEVVKAPLVNTVEVEPVPETQGQRFMKLGYEMVELLQSKELRTGDGFGRSLGDRTDYPIADCYRYTKGGVSATFDHLIDKYTQPSYSCNVYGAGSYGLGSGIVHSVIHSSSSLSIAVDPTELDASSLETVEQLRATGLNEPSDNDWPKIAVLHVRTSKCFPDSSLTEDKDLGYRVAADFMENVAIPDLQQRLYAIRIELDAFNQKRDALIKKLGESFQ